MWHKIVEIGRVVLDNGEIVRKLNSLSWDKIEVHANEGYNDAKWCLSERANIGRFLPEQND
jgi:hypothetical protein